MFTISHISCGHASTQKTDHMMEMHSSHLQVPWTWVNLRLCTWDAAECNDYQGFHFHVPTL